MLTSCAIAAALNIIMHWERVVKDTTMLKKKELYFGLRKFQNKKKPLSVHIFNHYLVLKI